MTKESRSRFAHRELGARQLSKKLTRREFLGATILAGAGLYGLSAMPLEVLAAKEENKPESKSGSRSQVVIISSEKLLVNPAKNLHPIANTSLTSIGESNTSIDQMMLNSMLDQSIEAVTGKRLATDAWRSLFKPDDVVGIKVNCIAGKGLSTHPELVAAIIAGLKLAGVPEHQIIVWDRTKRELLGAGYKPSDSDTGVIVRGSEDFYDLKPTTQGSFKGRLSRIITEKITALINVPILKDHGQAGITAAMKNHYGSISNPGDHHDNNCAAIADLNAVPAIRKKTRLIVLDAINATCHGGPGQDARYMWEPGTLMASTDPVALDYQAWRMIEDQRIQMKLPSLTAEKREPQWIAVAAAQGLGNNEPRKIDVIRKVILP